MQAVSLPLYDGSHNFQLDKARSEQEGGNAISDTVSNLRRFARNGYERDALSIQRIGRCAALCLDPYPQPRWLPKNLTEQTVPPCVGAARAGDVSLGRRKIRPPTGLPTTFYEPYFTKLLFGYMQSNSTS